MANQVYGYASNYGYSSSRFGNGAATDPYLSDPSRFSVVDRGFNGFMFSGSGDISGIGASVGLSAGCIPGGFPTSWPGADALTSAAMDPSVLGVKRPAEAVYHPNLLGTHTTIGKSEALFSSNSFIKRPRYESASTLPIYPQRPGEKDCAYYMMTRTCKFADSCKFDHPIWVPEGGIPDWKEVPSTGIELLPERPEEPDCPYFLKTQRCKFGFKCKFNHPKDKIQNASAGSVVAEVAGETIYVSVLPERPSEPVCSYYMKTGICKFGATCKFHHPKDIQISSAVQGPGSGGGETESAEKDRENDPGDAKPGKTFVPITPALLHNSKGLPIRPGEVDCPFYLRTGSCKYGATCRHNHPDRNAINPPPAGALGHSIMSASASNLPIGVINPAASVIPNIDPRLATAALGMGHRIYPQRPGQMECDFYMKTGACKFGERCKFHHPIDRSAPALSVMIQAVQQNVKLSLAGLPRREGAINCPYYMKTGACKYGLTCKFDHPPPGEVIAMAATQGTSMLGEEKDANTAVAAAEQL